MLKYFNIKNYNLSNFNYYSKNITQSKKSGAAQSMLYALGLKKEDMNKPQIGIGTVWFEGNPCNSKLNILSDSIKLYLNSENFLGFKFNTVGVSDGMSMGTEAMRYSLPSRELIADSMETIVRGQNYDGLVCIPGCDKNLPAAAMSLARLNRHGFIIYGGSMRPSYYKEQKLDIVSSFEAYGKYIKGEINDDDRQNIVQNACNNMCGSCSGFYTANTMACLLEVMGLTLPNSSSNMSLSDEKLNETRQVGIIMRTLFEKDIKPLDIMTKESFENAIKFLILIGGSTNGVIHLLAMAKTAGINLTLQDFKEYEYLPVLTNMKPHGTFVMDDLNKIGGTSVLIKYLIDKEILNGDCMTITGKTLRENVESYRDIDWEKNIIYPLEKPYKKTSHINILFGNLASNGCVSKIYSDNTFFRGSVLVYDTEQDMLNALENKEISNDNVIVIRYQGESIGCPEMLTCTSALIGYFGNNKVPPILTDGRFSGGSKGILVAHLTDAYKKNSITAKIKNGDFITIDLDNNKIILEVCENELNKRKIKKNNLNLSGYLNKYSKLVSNIKNGYLT